MLRTEFPNGFVASVRGVFTYRVDDAGLITNLRGYWNMDAMEFTEAKAASPDCYACQFNIGLAYSDSSLNVWLKDQSSVAVGQAARIAGPGWPSPS